MSIWSTDAVRRLAHASLCAAVSLVLLPAVVVTAQQPELAAVKATFTPGDRTLFYDDFADLKDGEAPAQFKVRGAAPELRAGGGLHQFTATKSGILIPNLTSLPKNFTYETEVKLDIPSGWAAATLLLSSREREALTWMVRVDPSGKATTVLSTKVPKFEEFGRATLTVALANPVRLALWVQDGRLRVFINGDKQLDINQVDVAPVDRIELRADMAGLGNAVGYRSVRIAESTPDIGQTLLASGRYVSHAILFDTDSDRLKPESAAAVQAIAAGLRANATLKVRIEGHTDDVGAAAHNLELSKRRADAVKAVLVSQFGIDGARLTTAGLGSDKPLGPNDSPLGRARNRRVEFVRQ